MSNNLEKNDDLFEYLSLFLNKTVVDSKNKKWLSVVTNCLNGLRFVKRLRENPERFKKLIHSEDLKTQLNEIEKR